LLETRHKNPKIGQNFSLFWLICPILRGFLPKRSKKSTFFTDFHNFKKKYKKLKKWDPPHIFSENTLVGTIYLCGHNEIFGKLINKSIKKLKIFTK